MENDFSQQENPDEAVEWKIDKQAFLSLLRYAAARDRTVIEFRVREEDDGTRVFDTAVDITEHVQTLEDEQDLTVE